jgi:uncharacterized membrane protein
MRTPASVAGHPIHPMLVTIPIGLWIFSFVCDLFHVFGSGTAEWRMVALYTMAGGTAGAVLAAIPGLLDLLSLPPSLKKTALAHMGINVSLVVLFGINLWLRSYLPVDNQTPVLLSAIGVALLAVSGWLGGKLVYVGGVAVSAAEITPRDAAPARDPSAHPDSSGRLQGPAVRGRP